MANHNNTATSTLDPQQQPPQSPVSLSSKGGAGGAGKSPRRRSLLGSMGSGLRRKLHKAPLVFCESEETTIATSSSTSGGGFGGFGGGGDGGTTTPPVSPMPRRNSLLSHMGFSNHNHNNNASPVSPMPRRNSLLSHMGFSNNNNNNNCAATPRGQCRPRLPRMSSLPRMSNLSSPAAKEQQQQQQQPPPRMEVVVPSPEQVLWEIRHALQTRKAQQQDLQQTMQVHKDRARARYASQNIKGCTLSLRKLALLEQEVANLQAAVQHLTLLEEQLVENDNNDNDNPLFHGQAHYINFRSTVNLLLNATPTHTPLNDQELLNQLMLATSSLDAE